MQQHSPSKSGSEDAKSTVQIVVAIIALAGALGGAAIANWDKLFPSRQHSSSAATTGAATAESTQVLPDKMVGTWRGTLSNLPGSTDVTFHLFSDGRIEFEDDPNYHLPIAKYQVEKNEIKDTVVTFSIRVPNRDQVSYRRCDLALRPDGRIDATIFNAQETAVYLSGPIRRSSPDPSAR